MNGILPVDKPEGCTSFAVIAKLRKKLNQKKIGHMGTLDPMATGVLPVLLGDTAKFQIFATNNQKAYIAKFKLGIKTDTLDITGNIISNKESNAKKGDLERILKEFVGKIYQIPPMFSAIKKDGVKLCDMARKGIDIEREKREIYINEIKLISFDEKSQEAEISVKCSKGTYVRTLCSDIGDKLGFGATVTSLRRTFSNGIDINSCIKLDDLMQLTKEEIEKNKTLPTEKLFEDLETVKITEAQKIRFKNGGSLMFERLGISKDIKENQIFKVYFDKEFVGLGKADLQNKELKVLKFLK